MPDLVISEFLDESAVADLLTSREISYDPDLHERPEDLLRALSGARGLIVRNRTMVSKTLIEAAPHLRVIGRLGVGLDNIDLVAARERGVIIRSARGENSQSVAEYVLASMLVLLRAAFRAGEEVAAGAWPRRALIGREIAGKTLGLIGFGSSGRATARTVGALGVQIIACDPFVPDDDPAWSLAERRTLPQILAESDVVSLHVPLTPETLGLIDAEALASMKRDAVLINAARGGMVDESALADALREGRLGGAALDVFADEPLTAQQGALFSGLRNVILTPHIAGVTVESNARVSRATVEAVLRDLDGVE